MTRTRWPFAARLVVVSGTLASLLAAAVVMLVIGRPLPVRAAESRTHTTERTLHPRPSLAAPKSHVPGAPVLPAGLPPGAIQSPRRPLTHAERVAHASAVAHQRIVSRRLARAIRTARLEHRLLVPPRPRSYNRRPRARSSAG